MAIEHCIEPAFKKTSDNDCIETLNIDKDLKSARHKEIAKKYLNSEFKDQNDSKLMCDVCELWNEVK